ncbi:exo-alpha-sialidase [Caulobacter sp. BP25]|uniref:exo-alpha-sialidase n=1 Tax=Caulobacter sp. BP25 TaxID=2048900 RepID=UPI00117E74DB|nr:exo-alpha-sialidase [Caulobacter sp. BP25]
MKAASLLMVAGAITTVGTSLWSATLQTAPTSNPPPTASSASVPAPPPFGPTVTAGRTLATADMTAASPLIPADIYRTSDNTVDHGDLATFAWLSFISAVSPASSSNRGVPGGSFSASGMSSAAGPLVWETYQHRTELLPCNIPGGNASPTPPQPWNAPPTYVIANTGGTACSTLSISGTPSLPYNNLDEATQIGQNSLFYPATPGASPNPATDTQVLFEARANQYEWSFVNQNYASLQPKFAPFRFSPAITLPTGTVEVKAAWRPLSSIPSDQQYRYHTATVITYGGTDAAPVARTQTYALIALHLIHKTPNYPAFIFATFEQVDTLTNQVTNKPSGVYYVPSYSAVGYSTPATTTFPPSGTTVPNPNINFSVTAPTASPNGVSTPLPLGATTGFQGAKVVAGLVTIPVTQPVTVVPDVAKVNAQALAAMQGIPGFNNQFVWQYYRLAGVQAIPTNDETTKDFYLANIVVESSQPGIQLFRGFPPITKGTLTNLRNQVNVIDYHFSGGQNFSMGGCQGCHGVAQTQNGFDFSFLFFGAGGGGFSPETVGIVPPTMAAARMAAKRYMLPSSSSSPAATPSPPMKK